MSSYTYTTHVHTPTLHFLVTHQTQKINKNKIKTDNPSLSSNHLSLPARVFFLRPLHHHPLPCLCRPLSEISSSTYEICDKEEEQKS